MNKRSKKLFLVIRNEYMLTFSTRNEKAKKYYLKARFCSFPLLKGSTFIRFQFYRVLVLQFYKTLEHATLIFTKPGTLMNEIKLNIMQNFKFDFLENKFWANWDVRFKFFFQDLFSTFSGPTFARLQMRRVSVWPHCF